MDVCTIIAKNYLAARARARRVASPSTIRRCAFHVLVIDDVDGLHRPGRRAVRGRHARTTSASGLRADGRSSTTSSSCRPRSSRGCCATCSTRSGDGVVLYLDPDIRLYGRDRRDVRGGARPRAGADARTTSRRCRATGKRPNEQDILIAGSYNLGFIGLGSRRVHRRPARLVGGAAGARLHRRPRARVLRRPALDRPRAGDGRGPRAAARSRLQRRLLEPRHAHGGRRRRRRPHRQTTSRCGCSTSAASTRASRTC